MLGGLGPPRGLISHLNPRLPTLNTSHCSSAETLKCHPVRKLGGLSQEEVPGHFQLLEILRSCPQPDRGNQGGDTDTLQTRHPHTRQLLPTVPHWHCREDCTVLTHTWGAQVLLTALQSVGKLKLTEVPSEQRKNKHLFRSATLTCSRFTQLPVLCKPV